MTDLLLIFPPLTEARLFPYLSLPMIAAYLRKKNFSVEVWDANIDLCHQILRSENFQMSESEKSLKARYRLAFSQYLHDNIEKHFENVCGDEKKNAQALDVQMVTRGFELLTESSVLRQHLKSLKDLRRLAPDARLNDDLAYETLKKETRAKLERNSAKCVGFSIAYFSQIVPSYLLSVWIKENFPSIRIIWGGPQVMNHASQLGHELERVVDALCIGDGEPALEDFLSKEKGPFVNCIEVSQPNEVGPRRYNDVNQLPTPDFETLPIGRYFNTEIQLPLITCVGCYWGRCAFCSYGNRSLREKSYRQWEASRLAEICTELVERYRIQRINFVDENTNLRLIQKTMKILSKKRVSFQFSTRNRMEKLLTDIEFCRDLAHSGLVLMSTGYETNSQRLLDLLDKGVEADTYQRIIDNLNEVGVALRFSVMGGLPQETDQEHEESLKFLKENASKIGIDVIQMLIVEPTTKIAQDPDRYGVSIDQNELCGNDLLSYGRGRVGFAYFHQEGKQFHARQDLAVRFFSEITTKNDDRKLAAVQTKVHKPGIYSLAPWVRRLDDNIIANFYQQAFAKVTLSWKGANTFYSDDLSVIEALAQKGFLKSSLEASI